MKLDSSHERRGEFENRLNLCLLVITVFFVVVFFRLFYLQIIRGRYFWAFSAEHAIKEIPIPASRGVIFDRNRIPMIESRPSLDLALIPQHVRDYEKVKKSLHDVAGIDPDLMDSKWKLVHRMASYLPILIESDILYNQAVKIRAAKSIEVVKEDTLDLRGVEVMAHPLRSYPQGAIAATTLGYMSEISEKELIRLQKESPGLYSPGQIIGVTGIEKYWEKYLRGQDGYDQQIVDAVGRSLVLDDFASFLKREEAVHGQNLILTIDSRLQKLAEERFKGKAGSLVALNPNNGEILAMVSLPSYNPEMLVSNVQHDYWANLLSNPKNLLFNRAIQGAYPPGSTFKILTAVAALEEGVLKPEERIYCGGGLHYGGRLFHCWAKGGHGSITVHEAIASSCDTFFYQMGLRLGVDRIARYAHLFGLGQKTEVDLEGEKSGLIPTAEWKKRVFQQEWQAGENLSIAVGQGYDTVTPLQNALMVAEVATGKKIHPHLLKGLENMEGEIILKGEEGSPTDLPISEKTFAIVRASMADVVASPAGTAHRSQSEYVTMAGKTGTAQAMSEGSKAKARANGLDTGDHAWFISFAPVDQPKIAVAAIVEHGGFGASAAAPIVKDVIEKYMELQGLLQRKK